MTHIYLAQLISDGFVDYVLTVNFDNLMLRALALFNEFPPTYDMTIIEKLTTTTFEEKSVVFLHGQHHGVWLLNTEEEMEKVKEIIPPIFNSIKNRPWIFIGYSGNDSILKHVKNLGRFDNGLYWVTHKDEYPNNEVTEFLNTPNTNAYLIKDYDADSFMLKLNSELGLPSPDIIDKPFSAVKETLENIVDIKDNDEHFGQVKERLETSKISKEQVDKAIKIFEKGETTSAEDINEKSKIDILKREIINIIINNKYNENEINKISEINEKVKEIKDESINSLLGTLFNNWGVALGNLADTKEGKEAEYLYIQACEKYKKAIEIKPNTRSLI